MDVLIIAATPFEIKMVTDFLEISDLRSSNRKFHILISGIGGLATTYHLTKYLLHQRPELIIQAGIAGSFNASNPPGSVVYVTEEIIGDLGAEENNSFKDIFDLGLLKENDFPFSNKVLINPYTHYTQFGLSPVRGISINEITTSNERIQILKKKYGADIESMEGAAFHYVCLHEKIPFLQIRSISNYVGERDKEKWKIKEAIERLNEKLTEIVCSEF